MPSYQYRKSHCRDKIVVRSPHLHNGIPIFYTGMMADLYWISPLTLCIFRQYMLLTSGCDVLTSFASHFIYLLRFSADEWYEMQIDIYVLSDKFSTALRNIHYSYSNATICSNQEPHCNELVLENIFLILKKKITGHKSYKIQWYHITTHISRQMKFVYTDVRVQADIKKHQGCAVLALWWQRTIMSQSLGIVQCGHSGGIYQAVAQYTNTMTISMSISIYKPMAMYIVGRMINLHF